MTTRKRSTAKTTSSDYLEEQKESEISMISSPTHEELEEFFTDPEPPLIPEELSEPPVKAEKKRIKPPKTGKVFLGEEDMRQFDAYRKFLKEEQGIKDVKHKRI